MPLVEPSGNPSGIQQARRTLTHAQILTLPTAPVVIVPATQTLNFAGVPARLPVPVGALLTTTITTAYTNNSGAAHWWLVWGSDEDVQICGLPNNTLTGQQAGVSPGADGTSGFAAFGGPNLGVTGTLNGQLLDNAIALALDNAALGNLTGGNAANTLTITVMYASIAL